MNDINYSFRKPNATYKNQKKSALFYLYALTAGWGSIGSSVTEGAKTSVFLVNSEQPDNITGNYFSDMRPTRPAEISYNKKTQQTLWEISENLTGVKYNF